MRKEITSQEGAQPFGPYSPAIYCAGRYLFISGQGPVDSFSGKIILGTFRKQAEITFTTIHALLKAGGAGWGDVVKVCVYLSDLMNFQELNEIYLNYFESPYPARTTVGVALLGGMSIGVDCIAVLDYKYPA